MSPAPWLLSRSKGKWLQDTTPLARTQVTGSCPGEGVAGMTDDWRGLLRVLEDGYLPIIHQKHLAAL